MATDEKATVLGGTRYGYEDDVYGSCSCGEVRPHRHGADSGRKDGPLHSPCTGGADTCDESMRYVCTAHYGRAEARL